MAEKIADKVLSWVPEAQLEPDVVEQVKRISRLPFVQPYVAVMPDCHLGMGAAIGSCIPTERALIPAAIGVDIGCGMIAVKTSLVRDDMPDDLVEIREAIEHQIPLSAGKYNRSIKRTAVSKVAELENLAGDRLDDYAKIAPKWRLQLGSLGSGNHFIELVTDEHESVWLFLHSGSRGIGNKLAMFHIRVARDLMTQSHIQLEDLDLAYLTEGTPQFDAYHQDLMWAQHFALLNRQEMMDRLIGLLTHRVPQMQAVDTIQCHHNFTQKEHHFGRELWVSRKGAIMAKEGQMGLIPGSMGTASYVVEGKGCIPAMSTSPHGAGRRFSRRRARELFSMDDFDRLMEGIEVKRSEAFLDELPGAYKDIDLVMEQSADLVSVVHRFSQFVNVKGA